MNWALFLAARREGKAQGKNARESWRWCCICHGLLVFRDWSTIVRCEEDTYIISNTPAKHATARPSMIASEVELDVDDDGPEKAARRRWRKGNNCNRSTSMSSTSNEHVQGKQMASQTEEMEWGVSDVDQTKMVNCCLFGWRARWEDDAPLDRRRNERKWWWWMLTLDKEDGRIVMVP